MATALFKATLFRHLRVPSGQNLSHSFLRSVSSYVQDLHAVFTDEEVTSTAMDVLQSNPLNKSVEKACHNIQAHPKVQIYPYSFSARVMSRVLDHMQHDPEVDKFKVFIGRVATLIDMECLEDLTKDQVLSGVLEIVKMYPVACPSKVTEEAHFFAGLGLKYDGFKCIMLAFQLKFKVCIRYEDEQKIDSCQSAADYIHSHLHKRVSSVDILKKEVSGLNMGLDDKDAMERSAFYENGEDEEQIMSTVLDIVQINPHIKSVSEAMDLVEEHPKIKISSFPFKQNVCRKLFGMMMKDPKLDPDQAYMAKGMVLCLSSDYTEDLTKVQVVSRVVDHVKGYYNLCPSKVVTEESDFYKDLGLNKTDFQSILMNLQFDFKLYISEEEAEKMESVKSVSDYIYDHLDERLPKEELAIKVASSVFFDDDDDDDDDGEVIGTIECNKDGVPVIRYLDSDNKSD